MHQDNLNIKIIKLVNGDDIVCNLPVAQLGEKSTLIRLEKPLQIKFVPQLTARGLKDYVALIKWTCYSNDNIVTIPKDKILTITTATEDMKSNYNKIARNYHLIESNGMPGMVSGTKNVPIDDDEEIEIDDSIEALKTELYRLKIKKTIH